MIRLTLAALLLAGTARAESRPTTPNEGYYRGLSTLYPYRPVYCPNDKSPEGQCFGGYGDMIGLPKSAPLPETASKCIWYDPSVSSFVRYEWEPRKTPDDDVQYVGHRLCYFEDKGQPSP